VSDHCCIDFAERDDGWWLAVCNCGWQNGAYPTAEDACDALMDHAYEAGFADDKPEQP